MPPWTPIPPVANGQVIDPATFGNVVDTAVTELQTAHVEWTSFTPTLAANGWSLGGAGSSLTGRYHVDVGLVHFRISCVFGTGMAAHAANWPQFNLPIAVHAESIGARDSVVSDLFDAAPGALYIGRGILNSGSVNPFVTASAAGATRITDQGINSTTPWTWAVGDSISLAGWYRAA